MLTLRGKLRDEGGGSLGNAGPRGGGTWWTEFSLPEMALSMQNQACKDGGGWQRPPLLPRERALVDAVWVPPLLTT